MADFSQYYSQAEKDQVAKKKARFDDWNAAKAKAETALGTVSSVYNNCFLPKWNQYIAAIPNEPAKMQARAESECSFSLVDFDKKKVELNAINKTWDEARLDLATYQENLNAFYEKKVLQEQIGITNAQAQQAVAQAAVLSAQNAAASAEFIKNNWMYILGGLILAIIIYVKFKK